MSCCLYWWQSFKLHGGKRSTAGRSWRTYKKCGPWKDKWEWKRLGLTQQEGTINTLAVLLMLSGSPSSHSSNVTCVTFSTGLVRVRRTWLSWGDSGITVQEAIVLELIVTVSTSIFSDWSTPSKIASHPLNGWIATTSPSVKKAPMPCKTLS